MPRRSRKPLRPSSVTLTRFRSSCVCAAPGRPGRGGQDRTIRLADAAPFDCDRRRGWPNLRIVVCHYFSRGQCAGRVGAWPQRFLHPRGKLLYHSSHLDLDQFTDKQLLDYLTEPTSDPRGLKGKIVDLHKGGLRDVQSVIATYQGFIHQREDLGDRWVRPSLFLEMFAQDPDEWICIDNVDTVGRWNIQVFGYQPPRAPTKQDYLNVCRNAYHWRSDEFAAEARDDTEEGKLERPPPAVTSRRA